MYWNDLSGHDNDGLLKSFDTNVSGWDGTNGLVFDGIDDIVTFFGDIGTNEYTLEFFLNMNPVEEQKSDYNEFYPFKRLIGEPDSRDENFPAVYISGGKYVVFYGQGVRQAAAPCLVPLALGKVSWRGNVWLNQSILIQLASY